MAFAAGYGSLSQFSRDLRQVFHETPSRLRQRRRRHDRLTADGGLTLRLAPPGVVDWPAVLAVLARRVVPGVHSVIGDTYRRTVTVCGDVGVLELRCDDVGALSVTAHLPHWEKLVHIVQAVRRLVGLAPGTTGRPANPVVGRWTAWEDGISQAVRDEVGAEMAPRHLAGLSRVAGTPVSGLTPWQLDRTFPTSTQLAGADLATLALPEGAVDALRTLAVADTQQHRGTPRAR